MPINAPQKYYDLEEEYSKQKDLSEKERILKEMMIILPKHKGTDKEFASLKRRMSLLKKKAGRTPQIHRAETIRKRWPRFCLVGYDPALINSSMNLAKIGNIMHGIVKVDSIPIQVVLIQNLDKDKDVANQSEIIASRNRLDYKAVPCIQMDFPDLSRLRKEAGIIGVYTEDSKDAVPLRAGENVRGLAKRLHLDIKKSSYAVLYGKNVKFQGQRVGLDHALYDGDRVFIKV